MTDFSFETNIEYHNDLNPSTWVDGKLKPEVRLKLLQIAKMFIQFLDVENFELNDIVLTGSNANFNWTKYSDYDVHIVTNYSDLECDVFAEGFYRAKKQLWNDNHDIKLNGHDVEMYVEDSKTPPVSEGVYSILRDKWIHEPEYEPPSIETDSVVKKAKYISKIIKYAIKNYESSVDLEQLLDKIYDYRKSGLEDNGEYSMENLVFKILRNQGMVDMLRKSVTRALDDELNF